MGKLSMCPYCYSDLICISNNTGDSILECPTCNEQYHVDDNGYEKIEETED